MVRFDTLIGFFSVVTVAIIGMLFLKVGTQSSASSLLVFKLNVREIFIFLALFEVVHIAHL